MNNRTLTALKGSIKKWEDIVAGTERDAGIDNCPLCKLFFDYYCIGCVVSEAVQRTLCKGTPYTEWAHIYGGGYAEDDHSRRLAQAELDFLRSLLPDPEK